MPTSTLLELRTRARQHADMEDSDFVSDAELNRHINNALWALDDKLHRTWEDYYAIEQQVTLTGTSYELPLTFYKLVGVEVREGGTGDWVPLKPYSLSERSLYRNLDTNRAEENRFRIQGTEPASLSFLPGFNSSTAAILTYYRQRPALVDDTDEVDYPGGWEEWAVLKAAIVCVAKEERDTTALEKLFALEDQRVSDAAPTRDVVEPVRVADVEGGGHAPRGIAPWRR